MPSMTWARLAPIVMLLGSNVFMTFAWYGHLKHRGTALWMAVLTSWLIALPEYSLAVPGNRLGSNAWSTAQLKTMQEVITLLVFVGFSALYLGEPIKWNVLVGFGFIAVGAAFVFIGR